MDEETKSKMREPLYVLQMDSQEDAVKRINELRSHYPYGVWEAHATGQFISQSAIMICPEGARVFMTQEELDKSEPYEKPTNHTICSPTVCRFMNEEYVDAFMNDGILMISTFNRCKLLEDSVRKDGNEGWGTISAVAGSMTIKTTLKVGNPFMLCTSLSNKYGDSKCYLEIFRLPELVNAIGEQLYKQGYWVIDIFEGPCVYTDRQVFGTLRNTNIKEVMGENLKSVEDIFEAIGQVQGDLGPEKLYFQKPSIKSEETEYRAVWTVHPEPQVDSVVVKIENPEQYARKVVVGE